MTHSAPSYEDGSRVNGVAESASASIPDAPRTLPEVCGELQRKVTAFLEEKTEDTVLRGVQSQVRVSIGVIEEALRRYG